MLNFMDHVRQAFYTESRWNVDNSYENVTATANSLLDFSIPSGGRLNVSSLATPSFATSYTLANHGVVNGSLSYLYSSLPLSLRSASASASFGQLVPGYRDVLELRKPNARQWSQIWHRGRRVDRKDTLLYGRLHLPQSSLEALYLRKINSTRLLRLAAVSDSALPGGGAILLTVQNDHAKYSTEYLCSSDNALLGVRGLYNFGPDPRQLPSRDDAPKVDHDHGKSSTDDQHGRLSAGAEAYFSPINKSGGMSAAVRFATLSAHQGPPYTMTLTLNPLMGNVSSTWAGKAGQNVALCSRLNFNFYSYESDVQVGMEVWRKNKLQTPLVPLTDHNIDDARDQSSMLEESVVKVRANQDWKIGLLWEGRLKGLLTSVGTTIDLKHKDQILGAIGIELSYSN